MHGRVPCTSINTILKCLINLSNLYIKPREILILSLYFIFILGIYSSTIYYLFYQLKGWEDYNYGLIIPFVVIYLIWERRDQLYGTPGSPSTIALLVLFFGLVLFWIGELGGELFTLYLSLWCVIFSLTWMHLGWKKLKTILFPISFLLTMFPFPKFIHVRLSFKLKLLSSQIGVKMMQLAGMTAYREGNVIDLGFTQLQVVDACSGLRYLIPLVIMGILFAYFFQKSWWKRIVLVLSTIPIAVFVNSLRIFSVGFLYQYWGAMVAEGFFHDFSGWLIFMVTMLLLFGEVWVLKRLGAKGKRQKAKGEGQKTGAKGKRQGAKGKGLRAKGKAKGKGR